jgi:hypothetical protein
LVAEQLSLLCLTGIPAGAVLGVLSVGGITKAATSLFSPEIFLVQNPEELGALITQNSTGKLLPLLLSAAIVQKLHLGDYALTNDSAGFEPSVDIWKQGSSYILIFIE